MENFEQSLKPLIVSMKFVISVNFDTVKRKPLVGFFVPAIGFLLIICHLSINGPCGLYSFTRKILSRKEAEVFDVNPSEILPDEPFHFALLIGDICRIPLFFSTPLIHFVFMIQVLMTKNWTDMRRVMHNINLKMNLTKAFHEKVHKNCLRVLVLLILVNHFHYWLKL